MDILLNRRSVRAYDEAKKISYELLKQLCIYASQAPTARNQASKEYIIVDDPELLNQLSLAPGHADFVSQAAAAIMVVGTNPLKLATPAMQEQDCACAVENILLGATQLGIGSCYIGVYPIPERMTYYNQLMKIEDGAFVFALIALGYPKDSDAFYFKDKLEDGQIHHNRY